MIQIKKFTFNPVAVNGYLLWDETGEAILIDPACYYSDEQDEINQFVSGHQLTIVRLLNTHGHFDHLMGNGFVAEKWKLNSGIHREDAPMLGLASQHAQRFGITMSNPETDVDYLSDGETIAFGHSALKVIHVPGHSPGSVAFYGEDDQIVVVGDILFQGSIGRTDLPGGNHSQLIAGIKQKLLTLDDKVIVYSGHGNETTIGTERRLNPFLK